MSILICFALQMTSSWGKCCAFPELWQRLQWVAVLCPASPSDSLIPLQFTSSLVPQPAPISVQLTQWQRLPVSSCSDKHRRPRWGGSHPSPAVALTDPADSIHMGAGMTRYQNTGLDQLLQSGKLSRLASLLRLLREIPTFQWGGASACPHSLFQLGFQSVCPHIWWLVRYNPLALCLTARNGTGHAFHVPPFLASKMGTVIYITGLWGIQWEGFRNEVSSGLSVLLIGSAHVHSYVNIFICI